MSRIKLWEGARPGALPSIGAHRRFSARGRLGAPMIAATSRLPQSNRVNHTTLILSHFRKPAQRISSKLGSAAHSAWAVVAAAEELEADIVVVGAGIIGLTSALALLEADPSLSVVLIDQKEPCAGATGAGQGYLWLAHRDPSSPAWEMAVRSKDMWAEQLQGAGLLQEKDVEWQRVGSMLVASTAEEAASLKTRATTLGQAGIDAKYIDSASARTLEPSLHISNEGGGLLVPNDAQINGRKTAEAVLAACRSYGPRFRNVFHESCEGLAVSTTGRVEGVVTPVRTVLARAGVIIAAGAWTGNMIARHLDRPEWSNAFLPRRGLLLEMPRPVDMPVINHGLMEIGYTKHYSGGSTSVTQNVSNADITFTATTAASGSLLIGSSREFSGWDTSGPREVVDAIMDKAVHFLPALVSVDRSEIDVRVGLRPFSPTGPMVGPVAEGLFVAAGHEGSGLTLGPATAELLVEYILGKEHALSDTAVAALKPPTNL